VADNPFVAFGERYGYDWVGLVRSVLGMEPDDHQQEILNAIQNGERRISIRSGHGVGKTSSLAMGIVCHALTRFPQATVATAPTSGQLFDALAAQTKALFKRLPPYLFELFEVKSESIVHRGAPEESFVSFRTSRAETPEALAGVHSEGHVLLIADEASGVPDPVFVAASGSMSGHNATTVLAGNPVRTSGLFFETHHELARMWRTIHISCVGHPRVSQDFLDDMEARYGLDTNDYRVRVLGEFPRADADAVIPFELLQLALSRDVQATLVRPIWGVDCARYGNDRSALVMRKGNVTLGRGKVWKGLETMQLTGQIKAVWDEMPSADRPETICVDAIGLGAGVADRLAELGLPARAISVSESPSLGGNFLNLKAELWWAAKQWFAERACSLNGDTQLAAELGWPRYGYTSSGKLKIETKEETKRRMTSGKSPDIADAFILTFAAPAVSAIYGSVGSTTWKEPLQRDIKWLV
jgi:hypothetical protein